MGEKAEQWRQIRVPSDGVTAKSARSGGGRVHPTGSSRKRKRRERPRHKSVTETVDGQRDTVWGNIQPQLRFNKMQPVYCPVN